MNKTHSLLTLACIAAAALSVYGCDNDSPKADPCDGACVEGQICNEDTNTCEDSTATNCTSNDDCKDGKVCKNEKCVDDSADSKCTSNDDCTDGKVCKDQKCVDGSADIECTTNDDCNDDKICKDQKCVVPPECEFDSECQDDLVCRDEQCVPECTIDDDCDGNLVCRDEKCTIECTTDDDCDYDLTCKEDRCVPECESDNDCSGAALCEDGHCVGSCTSNEDCDVDAGEICHAGECLANCVEDDDCDTGICREDACVECSTDEHCSDNANGTHCISNHCVACATDDDCDGTMICSNNACAPLCTSNSDCSDIDSSTPYCQNADQQEAAVCVQCLEDSHCGQDQFCQDNVCKYECEKDIDCNDSKKCDTSDHKCYECVKSADCGSNLVCYEHECMTCASNDADCDKIPDDEEVCPYNPNIKTLKSDGIEVECNYVTDADGTKVFEIWHPLDFIRLQEEIEKSIPEAPTPENCKTPADPDNPVSGECCNVAEYTDSCDAGKALSCDDGIVIETACKYGCDVNTCLKCTEHEDGQPFVDGNCCQSSFLAFCSEGKSQACVDGSIVEETCAYGCGEDACNHCNTPEDETKLKAGDCCDEKNFAQVCSSDKKSSLQCIDGIVQNVACEDSCLTLSDSEVLCTTQVQTTIKARLMQDINIADAMADEDIKDVPFAPLKVVWTEKKIDSATNEETTVTHDPVDSDYAPYEITDDTCVGRWYKDAPIQLKYIELDGQNHRIFFKSDDKSCSMVDSLFGVIENSYIHDISVNYNVRGLISSTFASSINHSIIENVSVIGNINLETKPALEEVDVNSYIKNDSLTNFNPYHYSIIAIGASSDNLFKDIQYKGNVTTNFTLAYNTVKDKLIPGISGLFGNLLSSTVQNPSVTVPEFVYSNGRAFVPIAWTANNGSQFFNPKVNVAKVSGRTDNVKVAASFVSGFGYQLTATKIGGNIDIYYGDTSVPGSFFYGLGYRMNNSEITSDVHIKLDDVYTDNNYYGIADFISSSEFAGIGIETGSLNIGARYFGLGYSISDVSLLEDIHIKTGAITDMEKHDGLAEQLSGTIKGNILLEYTDTLTSRSYYGLAETLSVNSALEAEESSFNTTIILKNVDLGSDSYYGIAGTSNKSIFNDINITMDDINYHNYFGIFDNPINSEVRGKTTIKTGNHTSDDTFIGLAFTVNPVTFNDVSITTGNMTNPIYFYRLGQEISPTGIILKGNTTIETGNMTDMGRFYGLARRIKGDCSHITIHYGDIEQSYDGRSLPSNEGNNYFSGLANFINSDKDAVISDINITIGNVLTPLYISPLFHDCTNGDKENKIIVDGIRVTTGDIIVGANGYKGDFDGLCRTANTTLSHIDAKFGNVYVRSTYDSFALTRDLQSNGVLKDIKLDLASMSSTNSNHFGLINSMYGKLENVGAIIHYLQSESKSYSGIRYINENSEIKNMVYYADVYTKNSSYAGFIDNIQSANISLENIFSAVRINLYKQVDETTHKASDGEVTHSRPLLFRNVPNNAITTTNGISSLNLTKATNIFWLKRHESDFASANHTYMSPSNPDEVQFRSYPLNATEYVLQSGSSDDIDPSETLSGCQDVKDENCKTPWDDIDHMISITEPNGDTFSIPWLK